MRTNNRLEKAYQFFYTNEGICEIFTNFWLDEPITSCMRDEYLQPRIVLWEEER